jgi:NAD+ synthase
MINDLKIAIAQVNPIVGDLNYNAGLVRNALKRCGDADLVVFSELVICGYPPEDLILMPTFIEDCMARAKALVAECKDMPAFILTTPWAEGGKRYNAALFAEKGEIKSIIYKNNLPNYGVFDEWRVFSQGALPAPVEFKGHKLGILICEDIWFPEGAAHLKKLGAEIILSPNGSPYHTSKRQMRHDIISSRVKETGIPLLYVNQVGGQDDLVYDGGSMLYAGNGEKVFQAPYCEEFIGIIAPPLTPPQAGGRRSGGEQDIYNVLKLSLSDYVAKNKFPGIILGMSGGIDSALSAAIAADALGADKVRCVMMPSRFTSKESLEDAEECAKAIGCPYEIISIESAMKAFEETIPDLSGLSHENMQSRIRGAILMSLSNQTGAMVLTTGNKSEMAVGYTTLYGDMCGGYNVLKDVYKMTVYDLAEWRNEQSQVIPERILTKAPSAELRDNQTDQDSLPPYEVLDDMLLALIEGRCSVEEMAEKGFDPALSLKISALVDKAEYKRRQSAPGPKITPMAFGRGRRYPITNGYNR